MGLHLHSLGSAALIMLSISLAAANDIPAAAPGASAQPDQALAMTQLATRFEHAEGVTRDFHHAAKLYCRAARMGRAEAQYHLGWMYANGRGVPRDDGIAAALFTLAAAQGHVQSQRILSYIRPNSATTLPACLSVAEWMPSLKLSHELAAAENAGAAGSVRPGSTGPLNVYSEMQAAR